MNHRNTLFRFRLCLTAAALLVTLGSAHAKTLFTFGTKLEVTQIRASRDAKPGIDERLKKTSVVRRLQRKYKTRYKSYTLIKSEHLQTQMGEDNEFALDNGKTASVKVLGYKADPKIVDLKLQIDYSVALLKVKSGKHWFAVIDKGQDGHLILVITPTLIQIRKP